MAVINPEIDYVAADAETDMPTPSDMAREQMASLGLNAPSILSSRNETRTEEEIDADRQTLAEVTPGIGDILAVKNYPEDMSTAKEIISQGLDEGELSSVLGGVALAGLATVGLLPSVTGVGAGAKVFKKAAKENLKKNLVKEFGDDGASKVVDTVGEASQPIKVTGVKPPKKTVKAYKLFKKDKNGNLYPLFVKMQGNKPLELNTWTKAEAGEINTKTGKVKSSLGDLAYRPGFHGGDLPIATHIGGKKGKVSKPNYRKDNQVWAEVEFGDDTDWQSIADSRALVNKDGTTRVSTAHITDQIPEGGFYRYKTNPNMTGNWLIGGELKINRILTNDEVKSINDAAGVADLPRLSELNMAEGGAVPMNRQMSMFEDGGLSTTKDDAMEKLDSGVKELRADRKQQFDKMTEMLNSGKVNDMTLEEKENFIQLYKMLKQHHNFAKGGMLEDGGLMDEGGTVDPVSGNNVPPGSTQEEVRDDIPAQLSEGEFVFPADVVRYIGLGNLMRMRQEAKMGLKMMDEMGQMGNSEEATMPDDLPFDINDLDMEDDDEYNTPQEFAVGGMPTPNPNTGVYYNPAATPTTGVATAPTQAASQQFVQPLQPQQAAVPTMQAYKPSEVPTFQQTIGDDAFGTYDELRQYKNEAGNILNVPFRNGQPISPIPEGYTFVDPEATKTEEVVTTPTTPQTTSVREEGDEPPGDTKYSTTDVTGIGYNRSKLTDNLRDIISEYGAGFGTLMDTFGKASIPGAIASTFGKDPRVATSSVTSGSLGGVFDAFRGVTDRSGGTFQNQKSYENTTELHNLPAWQQDRLAAVAGTTMKEMESFFKDEKGKGISNDKASKNMTNALASRFGLTQNQINEIANKGGNFNQTTKLARALSEKIAAENLAKERAAENKREQERAALDAATAAKREQDRINSKGGVGPGNVQTGGDEGGFTDTGPGGTGQDVGVDESTGFSTGYSDDGYNQGGLASKPKPKKIKKMKKGGLASKK